ncbi:chemotaxis protein CheW, partial [Pseudoxanthomonas indica]|uniref:chemotaxis protein CheW n=1 Tax=Pseudoxanthomonas indica TaxID=428993 RepID=UPI001E3DBA54
DQAVEATAAVPTFDVSADLLAEFDSEFPDQAVDATAAVPTFDVSADLLAEFDSEFPDQAVDATAAVPTFDVSADLLAEFDSEFPDQAVATVDTTDTTAALLAEFDAEFPAGAEVAANAAAPGDFAAAVAEETEADQIQSRMPSAPIRVDAPPAPRVPRNLVPPPADLPAYAKPVFDLLQRQTQDQAAQSPHGNDRRRASDRASRWLRMRCDDQHYALELLKVQEVVLPATLLPLRGAARHMLGVMNLRGQVVPVIDLGLYLDRAAIIDDPLTRIVVLEEQGEILGLRVSAVEDVTTLTDGQIEPPDNTRMCRITHPLFRGVARLAGQQTVILLDASELLR